MGIRPLDSCLHSSPTVPHTSSDASSRLSSTHPQIDLRLLYFIPIHAATVPLKSSFQVARPNGSQLRWPMSYINAKCPH